MNAPFPDPHPYSWALTIIAVFIGPDNNVLISAGSSYWKEHVSLYPLQKAGMLVQKEIPWPRELNGTYSAL